MYSRTLSTTIATNLLKHLLRNNVSLARTLATRGTKVNLPHNSRIPHFRQPIVPFKSTSEFDFRNWPDEVSAIHTSLGWFYIHAFYNQSQKTAADLNATFAQQGFDQTTEKEVVQNFIFEWCKSYTPEDVQKQRSLLRSVKNKKLLLEEQEFKKQTNIMKLDLRSKEEKKMAREKAKEEKLKKLLERKRKQEELAAFKQAMIAQGFGPHQSAHLRFRFKINPETKEVEDIKGDIMLSRVQGYFIIERIHETQNVFEISKMTSAQKNKHFKNEWKTLSLKDKYTWKERYSALLKSGKDFYRGEILPLESMLEEKADAEGYRLRKNGAIAKPNKKKTISESTKSTEAKE
ncbi:predicted protein [Lodderomyces elongisporus NRRL YB-4239]|uniref:Uncharacterized protein n=1 Tax=Lodderomyces elongisporus (strain ATCC 11503 / CBS 2605 / JCM 1781 / NBRC 1676 / NRRL YB-4239) TaxID=379508 RepID=A5E5J7_LODEL|nr:predicted protein [Lodderomyces elongisporus NRRL YB-4239]